MKVVKLAVLGYGNRGQGYTDYALKHSEEYSVEAIIEKNEEKTRNIDKDKIKIFTNLNEFLQSDIKVDIVCVATQDADHYENAITLLKNGYDLILEKPISNNFSECEKIYKASVKYNKKIFVCHVLRYTAFYNYIKKALLDNEIGKIINIQTNENIGYWHMAHSYVRGPWRNSDNASPIILAKCCHDLDLICWFINEQCVSVNSVGALSVFKKENKPLGSADYCSKCKLSEECNYHTMKIYPYHPWTNLYYMTEEPTEENIKKKIVGTDYDRCVFNCDNNVCDHQSVIMKFSSGAVATHTLSAFSQNVYRKIHIQGTLGELYGTFDEYENVVEIRKFDGSSKTIDTNKFKYEDSPHGGGDAAFMHEVYAVLNGADSISITSIEQSILSHKIAFFAEKSRLKNGKTIRL